MQMVEVSAEYLKTCGASISFAVESIDFLPEGEGDLYSPKMTLSLLIPTTWIVPNIG